MIVYDKVKWHSFAENAPKDIPYENGATHITFFLRWCIENGLYSKQLKEDNPDEIQAIENKNPDTNCREFLIKNLDGVFSSEELNTKGKAFAKAYYTSEKTKFAKNVGWYLQEYENFVKNMYGENYFDNAYFYVEYSEENYQKIKMIIDQHYQIFCEMQTKK